MSDDAQKQRLKADLARLRGESELGAETLDALALDGITVTSATRTVNPTHWVLEAILPERIAERFALRYARIVVADDALPRSTLHRIAGLGSAAEPLGDECVLVLPDLRRSTFPMSTSIPIKEHLLSIVWDLSKHPSLTDALATALDDTDTFDQRGPIAPLSLRQPRSPDVHTLTTGMLSGGAFGLYGLRKAGKSSVALTVVEELRSDTASGRVRRTAEDQNIAVFADVQGLLMRTVDELARTIAEALQPRDALAMLATSPLAALDAALKTTTAQHRRVCVVLDEYDLLFPGARGRHEVEGVESFFGLLRSHAQRTGLVSLLLVGRDPRWATQPLMEGQPNPLLGWLKTRWIEPLSQPEAANLLKTLGRRCCLDVGDATTRAAWEWSGGHVMLLRLFGSVARAATRERGIRAAGVDTDACLDHAKDAFVEHDAVQEICREVEQLLAVTAPDVAARFWEFASYPNPISEVVSSAGGRSAPGMRTLRNLGLVLETKRGLVIPEVWRWWSRFVTTTNVESVG